MALTFNSKRILPVVAVSLTVAITPSVATAGQDAKRGEEVYTAQKCQGCHNIGGKGYKANTLDGVGKKLSADEIRAWIVTPKAMATTTVSNNAALVESSTAVAATSTTGPRSGIGTDEVA